MFVGTKDVAEVILAAGRLGMVVLVNLLWPLCGQALRTGKAEAISLKPIVIVNWTAKATTRPKIQT